MRHLGWRILNLGQALFLCAWSVVWISAALVVSIFSRDVPLVMARHGWAPGLLWAALARMEVTRGPALEPRGPYVFVMNHQSMIDIPIAFAYIPVNLRFVAKKVLSYIPFLGWYMWRTGMVFVDRGNREQALRSLARAGEKVRRGATILAYPEGTRSKDGSILPFKKGPFVLAVAAGVPVVPVAVEGSHLVLPRDGFRVRPGTVRVRIGSPVPTAGCTQDDVEAVMKQVRDQMIDLHLSIGGRGGDKADAIALPGKEGIGAARPGGVKIGSEQAA